jgi:hypothetical protein
MVLRGHRGVMEEEEEVVAMVVEEEEEAEGVATPPE